MSRHDRRAMCRPRAAAYVAVAAAVLAACSTASAPGTVANASPTGSASFGELTQAFLTYAQCARTHGLPDLPDPVVDQQGNDSYPPLSMNGSPRWPQSVLTGCAAVWTHVHEIRDRYDASHGLAARANGGMTPAQALALSQCIRLHGFPGFPDPGPGGTVANPPAGFQKPNLSPAARAAIDACSAPVNHG
jgi:hypothetical protein